MAGFLNFAGPSARGWTLASGGRLLLIRGRSLGLGSAELVVVELEKCLTGLWSPICGVMNVVVAVSEESLVFSTVTWPSDAGRSDALG